MQVISGCKWSDQTAMELLPGFLVTAAAIARGVFLLWLIADWLCATGGTCVRHRRADRPEHMVCRVPDEMTHNYGPPVVSASPAVR